ncbi:hypothetical protein F8388_005443 [Cannabis sativa]|uniref:ELMO domain-containing protein n=1 Tax=Cannabis sativa TaxID=3483 RepID=A0A7J6HAP0_CANSA|nr:hypothetical protein F8388_005443 [Cannabis sativa]
MTLGRGYLDALKQLWRLAYPTKELPPLKSELWKQMGWQGVDPSTDFRGGGFISLENLIFFAQKYPIQLVVGEVTSSPYPRTEPLTSVHPYGAHYPLLYRWWFRVAVGQSQP